MELTLIARCRDGLILATSIEGTNDSNNDLVKYSNQAKLIFKKLAGSPQQQSVESGPFVFHYTIIQNICALVLCERNYPRKTAFLYLVDIGQEFLNSYSSKVEQVVRPYHFLDFDKYIQQAKMRFQDTNKFAINAVSNELQDVTRIMVTNIEDVIHRGEALNILENRASELSGMSKKYKDDAKALNRRSTVFKIAASIGIVGIFCLIIRFVVF
ncbi:unnamed protein product [Caenorhabditis sp. 36 PRJEB53466]|nr:unnamed protein product [Caenorhabditis sp. 36 PRJEB53466]